ncbi:MAG: hypothetical protein WBD41_17800 [Rhodococcus sp. (in: high G+C Gram-positive bacteria)]
MSESTNENSAGADPGVRVMVLDPDGRGAVLMLPRESDGGVGTGLRAVLECRWFDVVRCSDRLDMWIDDEGLIVGDPVMNEVATRIASFYGLSWQKYAGRVVFASNTTEGATVGLSDGQVAALTTSITEWGGAVVSAALHPAYSAAAGSGAAS